MAFMNAMSIVGSGMTAQQLRLDVVAENITNANTTRTEAGGPYRRKLVVMEEQPLSPFRSALQRAMNGVQGQGGGVRVTEIVEDDSPFKLVYDPTHPDANEQGYVELPNVDTVLEMADAMAANQALSADITAFNVLKTVAAKGLEIGK
ncbi:MAG: flagellar basal body rod protein FlgC [Clostridiales bacterium]|nr:flagellar basal body rod protein FlgC [Clostridiales bacterium]